MTTKTEYSFVTVDVVDGWYEVNGTDIQYALTVDGFLAAARAIGSLNDVIRTRTLAVVRTIGDGVRVHDLTTADVIMIRNTGEFRNGVPVPKRIREIIETAARRAKEGYYRAYGRPYDFDVTRGLWRFESLSKKISTN